MVVTLTQVTPTEPWYPNSMGPPTPQPARPTPTPASTPLTFDTAYNFSGGQNSIVQEFFPLAVSKNYLRVT